MNTKKKFWIILILLVSTFCFVTCKKLIQESNTFDAPEVKTAFVVQIFDAATGEPIGYNSEKEIKATILGIDKSIVVDIFGQSVSSFSTHNGVIALAISNSITPSAENPVDFVLDIECNGYLRGSLPIRIASIGGHSFIVRLVNLTNPPEGISVFSNIVGRTSTDGILESLIEASTPPVQQTYATTHVVIPSGTKILNDEGEPLSGDLSFQIVYFSSQSPIALDCFPGSFCVKTEESGIEDNGLFFSGGWADYELTDASGKVAKSFSNPISLSIDVPPRTYDPVTKTTIKTGDFYPIWNYRFTDGVWELEDDGLLQGPSENGNFFISYDAVHFSKKNADKKAPETQQWIKDVRKHKRVGEGDVFDLLEENNKGLINSFDEIFSTPDIVRLVFKEQSTGFVYWSSGYLNAQNDQIYIPDSPCDLPTIIEVWGGCPYNLLGSIVVNDLCTADPIQIELSYPITPSGPIMNVDVDVFANCEFARLRPNISVFYEDGCGWKYIGQVVNGHITIPGLESGKGYLFGVWIDNMWFDEFFVIDQSSYTWDIDLPNNICNNY